MQRRSLFRGTGLLAGWAAFARRGFAATTARDPLQVYTRLGLRPIINAAGTYTHLGGSLMPPEVLEAMHDAAQVYVPIRDLTKATGERIARLTGNEGALVTTGAAGAIFVGTCACIAGSDPEKLQIYCAIYVERPSQKGIIIGKGGAKLKQIGTAARADIEKLLGRHVHLQLFVKVVEDWRNKERDLDDMGIEERRAGK